MSIDLIRFPNQVLSNELEHELAGLESLLASAPAKQRANEIVDFFFMRGLLHPTLPRQRGGRDLSVTDLAELVRKVSQRSASAATTLIGNLLGYTAIRSYGDPELHDLVVSQMRETPQTLSFAMTEAGAGSDLQRIQTTARQDGQAWRITGEKNFITNGSISSHLAVFARAISSGGQDLGLACFYVHGSADGLSRGEPLEKIGWRDANTAAVVLRDVGVPGSALVGQLGQGLEILTFSLNRSKTLLAAMGVGIAERAMELVFRRLGETSRFGKPLLQQPAIKHKLAEAEMRIESAWLMAMLAASTWDQGLPAVREASMAKRLSGEVAVAACSLAMELFGARGYLEEYEVSRLWADAKAIEIIEGPSLVQELLIAKHSRFSASNPKKDQYTISPTAAARGAA